MWVSNGNGMVDATAIRKDGKRIIARNANAELIETFETEYDAQVVLDAIYASLYNGDNIYRFLKRKDAGVQS